MTEHEIVDAIECMALRFYGAFAWRVKTMFHGGDFVSVVRTFKKIIYFESR